MLHYIQRTDDDNKNDLINQIFLKLFLSTESPSFNNIMIEDIQYTIIEITSQINIFTITFKHLLQILH